jgi:protein TonB
MKTISLVIFLLGSQLVFSQTVQQEEQQKPAQLLSESKVNDTIYTPAEFPGGIPAIRKHISKEMRSSKFTEPGQFKSVTTFDVNPDGSISSVSTTGNNPILNQEMVRIIKKLKTKWKPATKNGQPVKTKYTMPMGLNI